MSAKIKAIMATFKLVRKPRSPKLLHNDIRQEVVKALKPVAKASDDSRQRVVANWENKPEFESKVIVEPAAIRVITRLKRPKKLKGGSADTNQLWRWIDQTGTKAHTIQPKRPTGVLRFPGGRYSSKTGARPARYGGPGVTTPGDPVYTKRVRHPGFPPRHFSEAINKDLRPKFNQAVDKGYKLGFRKVSGR